MILTKSEFLLYLKHPAWLWMKKHAKNLLPAIDAATQARFDAGNLLESYAYQLFPDGIRLGFNEYHEYLSLPERTQQALAEAPSRPLFQARFETDSLTCITDIVVPEGSNTLQLYEVKSSTRAKLEHEFDLAFQVLVLESLGYRVSQIGVIHIDSSYVRHGAIDPTKLLKTVDVTELVRTRLETVRLLVPEALATQKLRTMPDISPRHCGLGSISEWLPIYRSLRDLPPASIYDLAGISPQVVAELEDQRIELISEIPSDITLTPRQQSQREPVQIDTTAIRTFLDTLTYPVYFLDYETGASAIPIWDGTQPYQQVPSQYSLHVLDTPGGTVRHLEYIHREADCPAAAVVAKLQEDIGEIGSVLIWSSFEVQANQTLAALVPEHASWLTTLNQRTADLMEVFSKGYYRHPAFGGSASIKKVLPVLVPELSYKSLAIQEGQTAQLRWMAAAIAQEGTAAEREQVFQDLLAYCQLDTLAMVKLFEELVRLTSQS